MRQSLQSNLVVFFAILRDLQQPVVKVPRGQTRRICRGIEATKRRSIRRKYAEFRQRRARGKNASMARATFTTG
jgi:hypothetical protein